MRIVHTSTVATVLIMVLAAGAAHAQEAGQAGVGPRVANMGLTQAPIQRPTSPQPQQGFERKDPLVAGVLSWVLPGIGSYYAGNSHHGTRHVLIEVGGLGLVIAGAARTTTCSGLSSCDNGLGVFAVGYVVLIGNTIWAIITAVGDANHHNLGAPAKRIAGNLYLQPAFSSGHSSAASSAGRFSTVNVQVARLAF